MTSTRKFYIQIDDVVSGPYGEDELRDKVARNVVSEDTLVQCEGNSEWGKICEVFPEIARRSEVRGNSEPKSQKAQSLCWKKVWLVAAGSASFLGLALLASLFFRPQKEEGRSVIEQEIEPSRSVSLSNDQDSDGNKVTLDMGGGRTHVIDLESIQPNPGGFLTAAGLDYKNWTRDQIGAFAMNVETSESAAVRALDAVWFDVTDGLNERAMLEIKSDLSLLRSLQKFYRTDLINFRGDFPKVDQVGLKERSGTPAILLDMYSLGLRPQHNDKAFVRAAFEYIHGPKYKNEVRQFNQEEIDFILEFGYGLDDQRFTTFVQSYARLGVAYMFELAAQSQ